MDRHARRCSLEEIVGKGGARALGRSVSGSFFFELEALFLAERSGPGGIGAEVVRSMLSRLGDLGEDAGEKFEDVEGFALGVVGEGVVVRSLALIEEGVRTRGPVGFAPRRRTAQEVSADALDSGSIGGPDGGGGIDGESAIAKRGEKHDTLVSEKSFSLEQAEDFVSPGFLGGLEVDAGYGSPQAVWVPDPSGGKAMDVGMWIDEASETLRHGDDSGASLLVVDGFCHQLLEGLIGETGQVGEEFWVSQEITPEHLGQSEGDEGMADVFEDLVFLERRQRRGPVCCRKKDRSLVVCS